MIGGHPGGLSLTKRLLALTGKEEGTRREPPGFRRRNRGECQVAEHSWI